MVDEEQHFGGQAASILRVELQGQGNVSTEDKFYLHCHENLRSHNKNLCGMTTLLISTDLLEMS
jgi:hypothetical protein